MIFEAVPRLPVLITALTVASGFLDSLAFTYSSRIWHEDKIVWPQVGKAAAAFALGIGLYWMSIRYLREAGVVAPEVQTLIWFSATIIGVMVFSGRFVHWSLPDQLAAGCALVSLGWLIARTSAAA